MDKKRKASNRFAKVLPPSIFWLLWLLIPITFLGFYPTYYSKFQAPVIIHVHGALMVLWLAMAVIQPWLIKINKIKWHRLTGRLSYALIPCIVISGYLVLRYGYLRVLGGAQVAPQEYYPEGVTAFTKAADFVVIGSVYFTWLLLYYLLGITFRKKTYAHATFMLASVLTILGPSNDRLIGHICDALGLTFNAVAGNFTFGIVFIAFCVLLVFHGVRKLPLWPALTVLIIHVAGIFLYHAMPFHPAWDRLAEILFSWF